MICEACGEANRPGVEFCSSCGAFLQWDPQTAAAPDGQRSGAQAAHPTPTATRQADAGAPAEHPSETRRAAGSSRAQPAAGLGSRDTAVADHGGPATSRATAGAETVPNPVVPDAPAAEAAPPGCPSCGRGNEPERRFCGKCGQVLMASATRAAQPQTSGWRSWWARRRDARARAAKVAYRRSLPPLYRWRRTVIGVLGVALLRIGATAAAQAGPRVAGRDPVGWLGTRWLDLTGRLVPVTPVDPLVTPLDASIPGMSPHALTDGTKAAWSMAWPAGAKGAPCARPAEVGSLTLTIPASRVRALEIRPGLADPNSEQQKREFLPKTIGVSFDDGPCRSFELGSSARERLVLVDSRVEVTRIRIEVDEVHPALQREADRLSFTELVPLSGRRG